jgi:hypothetical protein
VASEGQPNSIHAIQKFFMTKDQSLQASENQDRKNVTYNSPSSAFLFLSVRSMFVASLDVVFLPPVYAWIFYNKNGYWNILLLV